MRGDAYLPIEEYAFLADGHSAALVSRNGSIDWCCMPRIDSSSCFGRLLDHERGGHFSLSPSVGCDVERRYLPDTLVLETTFRGPEGRARLIDTFTMREGGRETPHHQLLRVVEGVEGALPLEIRFVPRFDYGRVAPWVRSYGDHLYTAIGGDQGLVLASEVSLTPENRHHLSGTFTAREGQRIRLSMSFGRPHEIDIEPPPRPASEELDRRLEESTQWWRTWVEKGPRELGPAVCRSAMVLKGLQNAPTGAIAGAPTTSLPESPGGARNWDYRYSWIRDSSFAVAALADIGSEAESDGFRRFVERSAADDADEVQVIYGVGGEVRLTESTLPLDGYRGARPVRIGNGAYGQWQLDAYGEILEVAWRWHERGRAPDDEYWHFLADVVEKACQLWTQPDKGLWEVRGDAKHFVHSKVMCWAALDWGIHIAEDTDRGAPFERWADAREEIRERVERDGYDPQRGVFRRDFGGNDLDAALLLLPKVGFVPYTDDRMLRTADAVRDELSQDGLVWRYEADDGLPGEEGAFLCCSFWLAECYARQGRTDEAREVFAAAAATANDLGLFSEQYDLESRSLLGNFPQGLTHLAHIGAVVALDAAGSAEDTDPARADQ